jgi:hypothetical protein
MEGMPFEGDWHVIHKTDRPMPTVAASFQDFIVQHGQEVISDELERIGK